jgi:hypothetical protein
MCRGEIRARIRHEEIVHRFRARRVSCGWRHGERGQVGTLAERRAAERTAEQGGWIGGHVGFAPTPLRIDEAKKKPPRCGTGGAKSLKTIRTLAARW